MKKNKTYGIIYTVTNVRTGKKYVGATIGSMDKRKKDHLQKAKNKVGHLFQNAIGTLGPEAFKWEQVDTASSLEELVNKEKGYILEYNSKEDGFNSDIGGGFKKPIYQYSIKNRKLVAIYDCLENAANAVNSSKQHISRACLSKNKVYRGYYWSYNFSITFTPEIDLRKKEVCLFSYSGKLLKTFSSVAEAARITGINKSSIAKTCRGERKAAGGYFWNYKNHKKLKNNIKPLKNEPGK